MIIVIGSNKVAAIGDVGNVELAGISLAEAINMASLYPAQLASLEKKGKIAAGFDADLIIFNDAFEVQGTVFKGELMNTNFTN